MKHTLPLALASLLALSAGPVLAQSLPPLLSQTVGSGGSESFLVLDFQDGTATQSYAFGYRYSGTQYVSDEIAALANANIGFGVGYYTGYGPADGNSLGVAPTLFAYRGHSQDGGSTFGNSYWSLWTSPDGVDTDWAASNNGASSTALTDGAYDGWSWNSGPSFPGPTPVTPRVSAAVPEAGNAWLVLLSLPLAFVARRRVRA